MENNKNPSGANPYGEIITGRFVLRNYVGDSTTSDGKKFELATTMSGEPLLLYKNKIFKLSWSDICSMAEAAGLFQEE